MKETIYERFAGLVNDIKQHGEQELIEAAFKSYFDRTRRKIPSGMKQEEAFDRRHFKEFVADSTYFTESIKDIKRNIGQYEWLFKVLRSDASRERLFLVLSAKLFVDPGQLKAAYLPYPSQYFLDEYFTFEKDETLVDGGAYIGDTALEFINICPNFQKLYLFEPFAEAAETARQTLEEICLGEKFEILEKGLSDSEGTCPFDQMEGEGDSRYDKDGTKQIQTVTVDGAVDQHITFIKLDIEGMESEALDGARAVIQKYNPQMAICIYHKPGDFWRLPQKILGFCPDYAFELRQCMPHEFCDTILYCIPTGAGKRIRPCREPLDAYVARHRMMMTPERTAFTENLLENKKDYLRICLNQDDQLTENTRQLEQLTIAVQERDAYAEQLSATVQERDAQIRQLSATVQERDAYARQLSATVQERDAQIGQLSAAMEEWDAYARQLNAAVQERNAYAEQLSAAVQERDAQIGQLSATMEEWDTYARQLSAAVQERDAYAGQLSAAVQERDAQIGQLNTAVQEQGAQIRMQQDHAASICSELAECKARLEVSQTLLAEEREHSQAAALRCAELEQALNAMYASLSWRLTKPVRFIKHMIDRLFHR